MAADLALIEADPEFARSIGVTLRNWVPIGGSGELVPDGVELIAPGLFRMKTTDPRKATDSTGAR